MWKGSMGGRVRSSRMEGMRLEIEEPRLRPRSRELMLRLGRELMLRLWIQQVELAALPPKPRLAGRCSWRRSLQLDWNIRRLCACPPLCQGPDLLITALQLWQPGDLDLTAIVSPSPWTGMLLPGIMLRSLLTKREIALPALRANTIRVSGYLPHTVQPLLGALLLLWLQVQNGLLEALLHLCFQVQDCQTETLLQFQVGKGVFVTLPLCLIMIPKGLLAPLEEFLEGGHWEVALDLQMLVSLCLC